MKLPDLSTMNLNPRERRLVAILLGVGAFFAFIGLPVLVQSIIFSRQSEIDKMRSSLEAIQAARGQIRDRQSKRETVALRYEKKAPPLAGFLEQSARAQKLEVMDSVDRPPVPIGKAYTERSTVIHLKKAGMLAVSKFLETVEKSESPLSVTRLNIRKRTAEPDSYDVEVGISAYDRNEPAVKKEAAQ